LLRKLQPFRDGLPFSYHAVFNSEQLALLKTDLIPRDMDDKWIVHYEEPHLFVHRAGPPWQAWYRVRLTSTPHNGAEVTEVMLSEHVIGCPSLEHLRIINIVFKLLLNPTTRLPRSEGPSKKAGKRRWWHLW
jgi:hypothetical protein